jgi:hypothetical protein
MPRPKIDLELERVNLTRYLSDGKWHKAKEIPMVSRKIRAVCAEYPWQFVSTQRGYKLSAAASIEELEEARADLYSRITHLSRRCSAIAQTITDRRQERLL